MYYPRIISIDMYAAAWLWTNEQPYQQYPILDKKRFRSPCVKIRDDQRKKTLPGQIYFLEFKWDKIFAILY